MHMTNCKSSELDRLYREYKESIDISGDLTP